MKNLTPQERVYAEQRLLGANKAASARAAGYSSAPNENKGALAEYLAATRNEICEHIKITRDDVLLGLRNAVNHATTAMEEVAAWREIGRIIGAYDKKPTEIAQISPTRLVAKQLRELPDSELIKLAGINSPFIEGECIEYAEVVSEENIKPLEGGADGN